MTKGDKLIRFLEIMEEARGIAKEIGTLYTSLDGYSGSVRAQFCEDNFPLPKSLTTFSAHTDETDKHFVNISGIELFYLTDKEDMEHEAV